MKTHHILLALFSGLFVASCEKIIEVPLNAANPQIVVEAVVRNQLGDNYVLLSRSVEVYSSEDVPMISGATVVVRDQDNNIYSFAEIPDEPGKYTCPTLQAEPFQQYTLEITIDGVLITAESKTNSIPVIDSVTTIQDSFGLEEFLGFIPHQVVYHSTDPGAETNFYEALLWINDTISDFDYFGNDEPINGQHYSAPFIGDLARAGDSVTVVLVSGDQAYYDYIYSFSNQQTGSPFSASPGNPVSNIVGDGTLGYFAALLSDTVSMQIPD